VNTFEIDDNSHLEPFQRGMAGRRRKAALTLSTIWGVTIALHLSAYGSFLVMGLTGAIALHILRVLLARPTSPPPLAATAAATDSLNPENPEPAHPHVSILVAAKNEAAVIGSLVVDLCNLDYPDNRYDVWIIDDASSDRTAEILKDLSKQYTQLNVMCRPANSTGGKSGALNEVLPLTIGDVIAVFDADAKVPQDLLYRVAPFFQREDIGAVQVRKATMEPQADEVGLANWLIRGQMAEMAIDSFMQQQRIAVGGIGELRGNGQFVRRSALADCGGWNEETITDDLDLTLRLHLSRWSIEFLMVPPVAEEGVKTAIGLWHQRNRWAEGGYQRYLDYWRLIIRNRLGVNKTLDLLIFMLFQYIVPAAMVPDFLMAIGLGHFPVLAPLTTLTVLFSLVGMATGLYRTEQRPTFLSVVGKTALGTIYMLHWLPIMASVTARVSVRAKRLKWVKTAHYGAEVESLEA
jgi:1,2-diacylglycerol 3-beta-glucosyltransferase